VEPSAPLSSIPEKKGPNEHMQFVAALEICEDKKESIKTEGKTFEELKSKGPYSIIYDEEYPFSALGVVYSSSSNTNNFATGCLIGSNLVLSCAHSLFDKNDSSKIC
jgi:V8-like Glu-specific endopeptidase